MTRLSVESVPSTLARVARVLREREVDRLVERGIERERAERLLDVVQEIDTNLLLYGRAVR